MARVKRAVNAHKKRRTTLERASGYRGQRSRLYRKAKEQVTHSLVYSYRDRKARKGDFRKLWIQRINAAARANGHDLQPVHPGPQPRRCRGRPQDPGRPGRQRRARVRRARRDRQGRAARGRQRAQGVLRPTVAATVSAPPDRGQRPGQGGTQAQPPLGPHRAAAVPCRRPEGRRGRARARGCVVEVFATPAAAEQYAALVAAAPRTSLRRRPRAGLAQRQRDPGRDRRGLLVPRRPAGAGARRRRAAARRLVAICADVRDPGNAGTLIRTADAAGADAVVLAGHSVDAYNPKTVRASVGSLFHLPLALEPDPARAVRAAREAGLVVLAADGAG